MSTPPDMMPTTESPDRALSDTSQRAADSLDRVMPMHVLVDPSGQITRCGPTMRAVLGGEDPVGKSFWAVFTPSRRMPSTDLAALAEAHAVIYLRVGAAGGTQMRGLAVPACVPATSADGGSMLINLSFGIDLAEAVWRHRLTARDFAPTELAMELLYLQEAKSAVLRELQGLTGRLDEALRDAERQARTDPLTGLANRRAFEQALAEAALAAEAQTDSTPTATAAFAIAHVDLDHFKQVNDTLGHAAGDQVLTRVAQILTESIRRTDLAARVGGDEFVLLLRGGAERPALRDFGNRLIDRLEVPFTVIPEADAAPVRVSISASVGIAFTGVSATIRPDRLLSLSDAALYTAKRRGRGRCVVRAGTAPGSGKTGK